MKIAVIANCQGESLAQCLRAMNPELSVDFCLVTELQNGTQNIQNLLSTYDLVFAQKFISDLVNLELIYKVIYFPSISFSAFHPDITYLRGNRLNGQSETVEGLMSSYHSSIAIFGYLHGLTIDQILGFYNPYVFSRLGYIDGWNISRKLLLEEGASVGMPLNSFFLKWKKRGCFMYSFNHPELSVMSDIAAFLLRKAGILISNRNCSRFLHDPLQSMSV